MQITGVNTEGKSHFMTFQIGRSSSGATQPAWVRYSGIKGDGQVSKALPWQADDWTGGLPAVCNNKPGGISIQGAGNKW